MCVRDMHARWRRAVARGVHKQVRRLVRAQGYSKAEMLQVVAAHQQQQAHLAKQVDVLRRRVHAL